MTKRVQARAPERGIDFLFIASHGLMTPISAIRWGCNRLQRSGGKLSEEQKRLIEHLHTNAKTLSHVFDSMLFLARVEDGTYPTKTESVDLQEFLQSNHIEKAFVGPLKLTCPPGCSVKTDRGIFEVIFSNIFAVFSDARLKNGALKVTVEEGEGRVEVSFESKMQLAFLQSVRTVQASAEKRPVVGGTPGLRLSLVQSLLWFLDGTLAMREVGDSAYRLVARIPVDADA
ncbi:MAG: histidine kinase dimerization/phospho-acceptor domain-containing protein [Candidatus Peregrinibacteria bacterium]|nr:histidine kinase dimerization/phospho-acceptor domain-containing protein [Candidatus Peregrinibacteria bacterium]